MNIRKLCTHGATALLVAAGAAALASPAQARLQCNQTGDCWWTGDTPEYQRANSDYYAQKWRVRIHNHDRGYHAGWYGDHRYHDWQAGYRYDRDYNRDRDDDDY